MNAVAKPTSKAPVTALWAVHDGRGRKGGSAVHAVLQRSQDFLELAGSFSVPEGKRGTRWDEVLRRARAGPSAARR